MPAHRIAVICTHPYALPAIDAMLMKGRLAGIFTVDRPSSAPIFRSYAAARGAALTLGPERDDGSAVLAWRRECRPDAVFVFSYPSLLPNELLSEQAGEVYNFHSGPLPEHRGPDPGFHLIRRREPFGALTIHRMTQDFDAGPVVEEFRFALGPEDTYGTYLNKLTQVSAAATEAMMELLAQNRPVPTEEQDESRAAFYARPKQEDLIIDWRRPAADIDALIRACNPSYGGAAALFRGAMMRVAHARPEETRTSGKPGDIVKIDHQSFSVLCGDEKALSLDIINSDIGIYPGPRMARMLGLRVGDSFAPAGRE